MATVYKVNLEVVSPWCDFDEEKIEEAIQQAINNLKMDKLNSRLEVNDVDVKRQ